MSTEVGSGTAASRIGGTLLRRGDALGRFLVLESLGEGGMGAVVSAHDPNLDRVVAIKVLRPAALLGDGESEARARLLREAQAMAKLQHANVITVHEVGEAADQVFIAMELVRSGSLRDWMQADTNRSWRDIVAMFGQTGRGLVAAHRAGLVHRDFKPENVLVTEDGVAKITDFGLVSAATVDIEPSETDSYAALSEEAGRLDITLTQTGALLGTPAYMAPEQHRRAVEIDARADQFAFCVALWEALYGLRPFAGSTIVELAGAVLAGTIRVPSDRARVPGWIERTLRRGLSIDPADRFESMDALLDSLATEPSQVRRRMLTWGLPALALAVAGILVLARQSSSDRGAACVGFESRLAGVWDQSIKTKIQSAFLATARPTAAATFGKVEDRVDTYAASWVAKRSDACQATFVRGEQSDQLLDRRMDCYDRQLGQLRALGAQLQIADKSTINRALAAASNLPPLTACEGEGQLDAFPLPTDPEVRAQVDVLRAKIDDARSLKDLGSYQEGVDLLQAVLAEAETLDYPPTAAEAAVLLGEVQEWAAQYKEADATFRRAILLAAKAHNDHLLVEAQARRVLVLGDRLQQASDGEALAEATVALLERLGNPPREAALLYTGWGAIKGDVTGDHEGARAYMKKALALFRQAHGPEHPDVAGTLMNLGLSAASLGQSAEAVDYYHQAIAMQKRTQGERHPALGSTMQLLGEFHLREKRFEEAQSWLEKALVILDDTVGPAHFRSKATRVSLARIAEMEQDFALCRDILNTVPDETSLFGAHILSQRAFCTFAAGDAAGALDGARAALALAQAYPEAPFATIGPLNTLAWVALELGFEDESIAHLRDKLDRMTKLMHPGTIRDRQGFARTLFRLGRTREGGQEIDLAIEHAEASDPPNPRLLADTLNFSAWYRHRGRDNRRALQQAKRAAALVSEAELEMPYIFHTLGDVELLTGDYAAAREHCQQAADAFAAQGTPDSALSVVVCLGDAELGLNNPDAALVLFKQASQLPDEGEEEDPLCRARIDFGLARALWESEGPSRRSANHARAAEKALAGLQNKPSFGHLAKHHAAAVSRWLRSHRAPGSGKSATRN